MESDGRRGEKNLPKIQGIWTIRELRKGQRTNWLFGEFSPLFEPVGWPRLFYSHQSIKGFSSFLSKEEEKIHFISMNECEADS